jgi:hypothetical protein
MDLINFAILKNPLNWITVLLMLIFFAMGADIVLRHYAHLDNKANPDPSIVPGN